MTTVVSSSASTTSSGVASKPMMQDPRTTDYGRYGNLAADHMARWLPTAFAAIPAEDRAGYFRDLDDRVADTIRDRERSLTPPKSLQETDFPAYAGQLQMAHLSAEEAVLTELVYLDPEPGVDPEEPETDRDGAFIDRGWTPARADETGYPDETDLTTQ